MATQKKQRIVKIKTKAAETWNASVSFGFSLKGNMDLVIKSHNNKKYLLSFDDNGDLTVEKIK